MTITLADTYVAEQKLKIISERQNVISMTTIWKGKQILMTYNRVMEMLAPIDWVNEDEIGEEDYDELINVIKKYVRGT